MTPDLNALLDSVDGNVILALAECVLRLEKRLAGEPTVASWDDVAVGEWVRVVNGANERRGAISTLNASYHSLFNAHGDEKEVYSNCDWRIVEKRWPMEYGPVPKWEPCPHAEIKDGYCVACGTSEDHCAAPEKTP